MIVATVINALALAASAHAWGGPFGAPTTDGSSSSSSGWWDGRDSTSADFDTAQAQRLRATHGVLAGIAFVALFPLGAILVRRGASWAAHALAQLLACAVYAAAAGIGIYLVRVAPRSPRTGGGDGGGGGVVVAAHPIVGAVVLAALLLVQPALGWAHHRRFARLGRRAAVSHAHLWVGRAGVTLGIVNGGLGLGLAGASGGAVAAYSVVAAVVWALWMLAAVFGEVRRARGIAEAEKGRGRRPADGAGGPA
ncbi:hypothetical protein F5X99DRAFT_408090 [Biscogniauxia marginata]|nr:hypothetical protein F5X99DRAFT_408090 [Biscogniauxia marginata]